MSAAPAAPPLPAGDPASEELRYFLRLCITGTTPLSARAVVNIRRICEEHLQGRYDLEVIDIREHPELAAREQLVAAPTLVKVEPPPVRRFVGDMSETDRILRRLGLCLPASQDAEPT
jgi:circadian clock protein KaiB